MIIIIFSFLHLDTFVYDTKKALGLKKKNILGLEGLLLKKRRDHFAQSNKLPKTNNVQNLINQNSHHEKKTCHF